MSYSDNATAARGNPTLLTEIDRLFALLGQIDDANSKVNELSNRLVGPRPVRQDEPNDEDPYGDLQRLQVIVDRLLSKQTDVADGINHLRGSLYGFDGGLTGLSTQVSKAEAPVRW